MSNAHKLAVWEKCNTNGKVLSGREWPCRTGHFPAPDPPRWLSTTCTQTQAECTAKKTIFFLLTTSNSFLRKCVFTKHTHRQPTNNVLLDTHYLLSFSDAVSPLLTLHDNLMPSRWLTIYLRPRLQIQVGALSHVASRLDDTHVRKLVYSSNLQNRKQNNGEGLGMAAKITPNCVSIETCLILMMSLTTELE